jgi:predicted nuclease with TOPRIM domain
MEKLVRKNQELTQENENLRHRMSTLESNLSHHDRKLRRIEAEQTSITQESQSIRHKAEVAYHNSTADDEARDFMMDNRYMMDGNDQAEHTGALLDRVQAVQAARRTRNASLPSHHTP